MNDPHAPRPPLLRDPIFRRLMRMVLAHRGALALGIVAMAIAASTEALIPDRKSTRLNSSH